MKKTGTYADASEKISITVVMILVMLAWFSQDMRAQPCSGIPPVGVTTAFQNPVCPGAQFVVILMNQPPLSGITFQWQSSLDGINFQNIAGATQLQVVTSELQPTYFQCRVRCTSSGQSSFSLPLLINLIQPTITYPPSTVQLNIGESTQPENTGYVTFSSPCCSGSVTYSDAMTSTCCQQTITRTWTIIDCAGEGIQYSQTITIILDVSSPVITCATLPPGACNTTPTPDPTTVTVVDQCPGSLTVSSSEAPGPGQCEVVTTFIWTATDQCGHSSNCTQTYSRIMDSEPPVIVCPDPVTLPCNTTPTPSATLISATDNCGTPEISLVSSSTSSSGCFVTYVFIWRATDACGNFSDCSQVLTSMHDLTPPVIICPPQDTFPCNLLPFIDPSLISATDDCGTPLITLVDVSTSSNGCWVTVTDKWMATDECGNTSFCDQLTTACFDETPPEISCPGPTSIDCNTIPDPDYSSILATDNCVIPVLTLVGNTSSTVGCVTTYIFRWRATDACGNFAECNQVLTSVFDEIDPYIECPEPETLPCNTVPVADETLIVAADNCSDPEVTLTSTSISSVGCLTIFEFTWRATDDCGNYSECTQVYFSDIDLMPPVIVCPLTPDTLCNVTPTPSASVISATDNCGTPVISFLGSTTSVVGCLTTYNFTWKATDDCGNFSTCVQVIRVINDQVPPVITGCPNTMTVPTEEGICGAHVNWIPPTATDNCILKTFINDYVPGGFYPVGETIVTYTATDFCGNQTICQFTINVVDLEPPWNVNCPGVIIQDNDPGLCSAVVSWNVTATDNCAVADITSVPASGSVFQVGVTPVLVTVTDINGNTWTCAFNVHVNDTEKPVIHNCPGNIVANNDPGLCTKFLMFPNIFATDNCEIESFTVTPFFNIFPVGVTPVTYTATDIHGNVEKCKFNVTIIDNELPVINNCPANIRVDNDPTLCRAEVTWVEPTAVDNCGIFSFVSNYDPGDDFPVGVTNVIYTATDVNGNVKICMFTVTVDDVEDPFILSHDIVTCDSIVFFDFIIGDNCGLDEYSYTPPSGSVFQPGTTPVYVEAWDINGNFAFRYFNVTVLKPPSEIDTFYVSQSEICLGDSVTLTALFDTLGSGGRIKIYEGSCDQAFVIDSSDTADNSWSLKVKPSVAGIVTYYVRIEGLCDTTECKSVSVTITSCPTNVTLQLKLFIEGFYRGNWEMIAVVDPGSYPLICDTVLVELHEPVYPYLSIYSDIHTIDINGMGEFTFPNNVLGQSYYIAVHHRNSIETWSKLPVTFTQVTSYDFTTSSLQAYDDGFALPMTLIDVAPDRWAIYSGDTNLDGAVDALDMTLEENASNLALFGYYATDINGDGASDALDMTIIENNSNAAIFAVHP